MNLTKNNDYEQYGDDYFYYYDDINGTIYDEEWINPCHEYEFSIVFLLVFSCIVLAFVFFLVTLIRKRKSGISASDIAVIGIGIAGLLLLSPKVWHILLLHGHNLHVSQTACKLSVYTNVGMAHVTTAIVLSIVPMAQQSLAHGVILVDSFVRQNLAWFLLAIFSLEGVTGMVPAMYMDLSTDGNHCNATQSMSMSVEGFAAGHILLFSILPYLLPFLVVMYPLVKVTRGLKDMDDRELWTHVKTMLVIVWSYIVIYTPLPVVVVVIFSTVLNGSFIDLILTCHFEQVFKFFQETWFIFVLLWYVWRDEELSGDSKMKAFITKTVNKMRQKVDFGNRNGASDRVRLA